MPTLQCGHGVRAVEELTVPPSPFEASMALHFPVLSRLLGVQNPPKARAPVRLRLEELESRALLSGLSTPAVMGDIQKVIMAGKSPDTPAARVDANISTSPFAGVGSISS